MEENMQDKVDLLLIKNHILLFTEIELLEIYNTKELFNDFLDRVNLLENLEPELLTIDKSNIDTIQNVINKGRLLYKNSEINAKCNELIIMLNNQKNCTDIMQENANNVYYLVQTSTRGYSNDLVLEELEKLMAYDAMTFSFLTQNVPETIQLEYFASSINYFLIYMPEMFHNEEILSTINDFINGVTKSIILSKNILKKDNRILIKKLMEVKDKANDESLNKETKLIYKR